MAVTVADTPLARLVEDLSLYPRNRVDDMNVSRLVEAIKAGAVIPNPVADKKTKTLVDGFHRVRAYRRVLGANGVIPVELRDYKSRAEMLLDAIKLNSSHGRQLDRVDQTRSVVLSDDEGIPSAVIAAALHIPERQVQKLRIRVAVAPDAQHPGQTVRVMLKRPMAHFQGQTLTEEQATAHKSVAGTSYLLQVRQIKDACEYDLFNPEDEAVWLALQQLQAKLGSYISRHTGVSTAFRDDAEGAA